MKIEQVAAQLYTVRAFLKTPADIRDSLRRIRELGYRAVQVSGMGPIPEMELDGMLRDEGLVCCATHEPGDMILREPQRVVERLRALRARITAYPFPKDVNFDTRESVNAFCRQLNEAGRVLHEAGMTLCYHNHQIEFRRLGGRTVLEMIYGETDPRYVQGEPDTYWIQYGGGDPAGWCGRLQNRLPIVHLKDYVVLADNKVSCAEIGQGNLDWPSIIAAADAAGCQWFCVEQDTCPGDPFVSLGASYQYIKENLCSR